MMYYYITKIESMFHETHLHIEFNCKNLMILLSEDILELIKTLDLFLIYLVMTCEIYVFINLSESCQ